MYVMLPEWNHTIAEVLTAMKSSDWMSTPVMTDDVHLSLPQFSSESDLDLKDILKALGMPTMFAPGQADFSGMIDLGDTGDRLFISMFKQVARIEVDENGTKAAAVTITGTEATSIPNNDFNACRPFVYVIVENSTHTICFIGQFTGKGTDASACPINVTSISRPQSGNTPVADNLFDMTGRRVLTPPQKGLYIRNGRKILVK